MSEGKNKDNHHHFRLSAPADRASCSFVEANCQPITKVLSNNVLPHNNAYFRSPHPVARLIIDIMRVNAAIVRESLKGLPHPSFQSKQLAAVPVVL